MKVLALSVLCLVAGEGFIFASAQTAASPTAPSAAPPAKPAVLPGLPDETPVASLDDGAVMTMGELRGLLTNLDAQQQQKAIADLPGFLDQWALFRKIGQMAVKDKLDQDSPVKERLLWQRTLVLFDAELQRQGNPPRVENEELEQRYNQNKNQYLQVKTDAIYIAFSNSAASQIGSDGKKVLSESEARAVIDGLRDQISKGADFKQLAKQYSDDEISRAKDGVFATLTPADKIPDAIRNAVFALKLGETTDVIGMPNGFYLFRAEEIAYKPFSEVRDQILTEIKTQRFQSWFSGLKSETKAKILNPAIK